MNFEQFEAFTFDCYGTLIDWESGILAGVRIILGAHDMDDQDDNRILERFGLLEAAAEAGAFRPYRAILEEVASGFGEVYGFATSTEEARRFAESVSFWPPFSLWNSTDASPSDCPTTPVVLIRSYLKNISYNYCCLLHTTN